MSEDISVPKSMRGAPNPSECSSCHVMILSRMGLLVSEIEGFYESNSWQYFVHPYYGIPRRNTTTPGAGEDWCS